MLHLVLNDVLSERIAASEDGGLTLLSEELRLRDSTLAVSTEPRGKYSTGSVAERVVVVSGQRLDVVVEAATRLSRLAAAPARALLQTRSSSHQSGPSGHQLALSSGGSEVDVSTSEAVSSPPSTVSDVFCTIAIKGFPNVKDETELLPLREKLRDSVQLAIKRRRTSA